MSKTYTGKLVMYRIDQGWGFLATDDGQPDVFVHRFDMVDEALVGRMYRFQTRPSTSGRHRGKAVAFDVRRIDGREEERKHSKALEIEAAWRSLPLLKARGAAAE